MSCWTLQQRAAGSPPSASRVSLTNAHEARRRNVAEFADVGCLWLRLNLHLVASGFCQNNPPALRQAAVRSNVRRNWHPPRGRAARSSRAASPTTPPIPSHPSPIPHRCVYHPYLPPPLVKGGSCALACAAHTCWLTPGVFYIYKLNLRNPLPSAGVWLEFGRRDECDACLGGAIGNGGSLQHGQFAALRTGGWSAVNVDTDGSLVRARYSPLPFPDPMILVAASWAAHMALSNGRLPSQLHAAAAWGLPLGGEWGPGEPGTLRFPRITPLVWPPCCCYQRACTCELQPAESKCALHPEERLQLCMAPRELVASTQGPRMCTAEMMQVCMAADKRPLEQVANLQHLHLCTEEML